MVELYYEDFTGLVYHALDEHGNPINEITTVDGWTPFWREDASAVIFRPEMQVIDAEVPFLDPPRTNGIRGLKVFKLYSRHDAGYWKRFSIPAGTTTLQLGARGHHWYSQRNNAYLSEYTDTDGAWNTLTDGADGATIMLGVDVTGGTDPWAAGVIWTQANIYDHFATMELSIDVSGALVTVFLRSQQLWPFLHTDAYWADVTIEGDGAPRPECWGLPRVQYARRYNVIPQDATLERATEIFQYCWTHNKQTVGGSSDDAGVAALLDKTAVEWDRPLAQQQAYQDFYRDNYPVARVEFAGTDGEPEPPPPDPEPDPEPPPPDWTPINYVPTGTKLSFHCIGSYPADRTTQLAAAGVTLSSIKLLQVIGDFPVTREPFKIGRIIDHNGVNLEGFNYNPAVSPEGQAEARMAALMPLFAPYKSLLSFIELVNEQDCPSTETHVLLARFFIRAMEIAEANGHHIALFSHSLGNPEPQDWDVIVPTGIFEKAAAGGHAISLHEYGDASYGPGSIICRYRDLYNRIILPRGLNIPLFITEYNMLPDIQQGTLMQQWAAYDALVRQDPYVAGVQVFTLGTGMGWDDYAIPTVATLTEFVNYAISQKGIPNG